MISITIHGINKNLEKRINSRARAEGLSINKTVKKLLEESLGIKPAQAGKYREDFKEFCGMWSKADLAEFEAATEDSRKINAEDWQKKNTIDTNAYVR
jgi:hypothetical protein